MKYTAFLVLAAFLGFAQAEYYNNVPIPGRRPLYVNGTASQGIDIQITYSLMCIDSATLDPEF